MPSAYAGAGLSRSMIDQPQDFPEQGPRHRHLGHLERDVPAMADRIGSDPDQLLSERRQGPLLDILGQHRLLLLAMSGPDIS